MPEAPSVPREARLYLHPVGIGPQPTGEGAHLPLAGGPLCFHSLQAIFAVKAKRIYEGIFPVSALGKFRDTLPKTLTERFDALLARLTTPRPPVCGIKALSFAKPRLMGILNVTPDSFSDGGDFLDGAGAVKHARVMAAEGADIIDIGAESTRPGAKEVSLEEELTRLTPLLEAIPEIKIPVSVDTRKAKVMARAIRAGATLINDVSALRHDKGSLAAVRKSRAGIVLMHARGDPATMQKNPVYKDVLLEVFDFLEERIGACGTAGIGHERLVADPGFGFGKTREHNLLLLRNLSFFHGLGVPLLVGLSRKRFIGELGGEKEPKRRGPGSIAGGVLALMQGAQILRCHDVRETRQALQLTGFYQYC